MTDLKWLDGTRGGTSLVGWLDLPGDYDTMDVDAAIATLEAAAGTKGDWEFDPDHGWDWWGLHGTFKGAVFTLYTRKTGKLKIGAHVGYDGGPGDALDLAGLKAALLALIG